MIRKLSAFVATWLLKEGVVADNDREIFAYAAYSLLFGLLPVFFAILFGMLFGIVKESIILILPFILVRKFSGGYHLKTPGICVCVSSILIFTACALLKYALILENLIVLSSVVALSCISLCILSPIDSDSRKLNSNERKVFRRFAQTISCGLLLSFCLFWFFEINKIAIPLGMGLTLAAALQLPCIIKHRTTTKHKPKEGLTP